MFIPESKVRELLRYEDLIPAIRQALIEYSAREVTQPLRQILTVNDAAGGRIGWFATMPVIGKDFLAVKTVTFYPGNSQRSDGLETHLAVIELLERATGRPLAVMDGRLITEMRTAAVSAVAVQALAPKAKTLGIIGSGVQARAHVSAMRLVQPSFCETGAIRVWSRNPEKSAVLAAEVGAKSVSIEEAAGCDVVVTVTSATEPLLQGRWLSSDSLVVAVGAVSPQLRELDDVTMQGTLIAESKQAAESESGDVILSGARVFAELGEVLAGTASALPAGRRVFKSVGMAVEDLAGAMMVWKAFGNS